MVRLVHAFLPWLLVLLLTTCGIELGLRLFPGAIPLTLLKYFGSVPRDEIASRLELAGRANVYELKRSDGGPPLKLYKPNAKVAVPMVGAEEPGAVSLDRNGFCNADEINDLPQLDIVAVGDSFTYCSGLRPADAWPAQLAMRIGRSVLNLGHPGIGVHEYVELLRAFAVARRPRLVILNFYEGNDLRDALRYRDFVATHNDDDETATQTSLRGRLVEGWLGRASYAWNLAVVGIDRIIDAIKSAWNGKRPDVDFRYKLLFPEGTVRFNDVAADLDEVRIARRLTAGAVTLDAVDDGLARLAALSRKEGFRAIVAYSPSAYTAYQPFVHFADTSLDTTMRAYSLILRQHVAATASRLGLGFVDLTPALQAGAVARHGSPLLYGSTHLHFTAAGSGVVADALAATLATNAP